MRSIIPYGDPKRWAPPSTAARARSRARACILATAPTTRATRRPRSCSSRRASRIRRAAPPTDKPLDAAPPRAHRCAAARRIERRVPLAISRTGLLRGSGAVRGRARAGAALADRRADRKRFAPWAKAPRRAPHPGHRHRLGRDRARLRQGLSARPGGCGRYLRRRARGVPPQRAQPRLEPPRAGAAIGSFRRRGGLPLRYHRQQPALCRARGDARLAARVPARAAAGAGRGERWAGLGARDLCRGAASTWSTTASWSSRSATPRRRCCARFRGCRSSGPRSRWAAAACSCCGRGRRRDLEGEITRVSGNTFGRLFTVTSFGESHGPALGCVVDGCPPGLALSEADLQADVDRRRPGTSQYTSQRRESRTRCGSSRACSRAGPPARRSASWSRTRISARATTRRSRTGFVRAMPTTPTSRNTAFAIIAAAAAPRRARR